MLPGEVKEQRGQWVNQVPVIGFHSSKYHINMMKEYFVEEISYNNDDECNEDVFVAKQENDHMFSGADSGLVKLVEMTYFFFNNYHRLLDIKWLIFRQVNKAWFSSDS